MNNLRQLSQIIAPLSYDNSLRVGNVYRNRLGITEEFLKNKLNIPQTLYRWAYLLTDTAYLTGLLNNNANIAMLKRNEPSTAVSLWFELNLENVVRTDPGYQNLNSYANNPTTFAARPAIEYFPGSVEVQIINHRSLELFERNARTLEAAANTERATNAEEILLTTTPNTTVRLYKTTVTDAHKVVYHLLTMNLTPSTVLRLRRILFADAVRAIEVRTQAGPFEQGTMNASLVTLFDVLGTPENDTTLATWLDNCTQHAALTELLFGNVLRAAEEAARQRQRNQVLSAIEALPDARLRQAENSLESARREMLRQQECYISACHGFERAYNAYTAVKYSADGANAMLKQFFTSLGDNLLDIWTTDRGTIIHVIANTVCTYFDPNKVKGYFTNPRSELNEQPQWIRNLIYDVFYKKTIKLKMTVGFSLNTSAGYIHGVSASTTTANVSVEDKIGIPNPHHEFYDCWGDNTRNISKAIEEGNIMEACMCAYAATAGINLSDTSVFSKMLQYFRTAGSTVLNKPCIINEDGSVITLRQYKENNNVERERVV